MDGQPEGADTLVYRTPAPDFELSCIHLEKGNSTGLISRSVEIFLLFSGMVEISMAGETHFKRNKGEAWVSFDTAQSEIRALEDSIIYQASIPGMS
jgi:hypothetical protein